MKPSNEIKYSNSLQRQLFVMADTGCSRPLRPDPVSLLKLIRTCLLPFFFVTAYPAAYQLACRTLTTYLATFRFSPTFPTRTSIDVRRTAKKTKAEVTAKQLHYLTMMWSELVSKSCQSVQEKIQLTVSDEWAKSRLQIQSLVMLLCSPTSLLKLENKLNILPIHYATWFVALSAAKRC